MRINGKHFMHIFEKSLFFSLKGSFFNNESVKAHKDIRKGKAYLKIQEDSRKVQQ